jgi:peptide/nickel transport system substrate-binding protein
MRPPNLRRALTVALAAAAACAATACGKQDSDALEVVVIGSQLRLVDPSSGPLTAPQALLIASSAQGLVRLDARGQIEPGLAERWNVSDDGLSYIFRLANTQWPSGRKVTAEQVARMLRRMLGPSSKDELKDALGAIDEVVSMTDRVLEIRLTTPRPELLQLLAQPAMGLVYRSEGTGPFTIGREDGQLLLTRTVSTPDEEETSQQRLRLSSAAAEDAVKRFTGGKADLVLGGTFVDLPTARASGAPATALRFDPASGLFGLLPIKADGPLATPEARELLSQAIDRDALIAALNVPGLLPRATVLEAGLSNVADPSPPAWSQVAVADRRLQLSAEVQRRFAEERPTLSVHLPDGPGAQILFGRLQQDWAAIGLTVEQAQRAAGADLILLDLVAPSTSSAWFLRRFRCEAVPVCDPQVDELLDNARSTPVAAQRSALLLEASKRIDALQLFIPLAAPIRWSLVSNRVTSFAGNRFARHSLAGLEEKLGRGE